MPDLVFLETLTSSETSAANLAMEWLFVQVRGQDVHFQSVGPGESFVTDCAFGLVVLACALASGSLIHHFLGQLFHSQWLSSVCHC